jgi:hypothetical protein
VVKGEPKARAPCPAIIVMLEPVSQTAERRDDLRWSASFCRDPNPRGVV